MPLQVDIVTPDKVLLKNEQAEMVTVPAEEGEMGFEEGHALLLATLKIGQVRIFTDDPRRSSPQRLATSRGFVEVSPERVLVLAESAERADQIDVTRARGARDRAQSRLDIRPEALDVARAEAALQRALNRLQVARQSAD